MVYVCVWRWWGWSLYVLASLVPLHYLTVILAGTHTPQFLPRQSSSFESGIREDPTHLLLASVQLITDSWCNVSLFEAKLVKRRLNCKVCRCSPVHFQSEQEVAMCSPSVLLKAPPPPTQLFRVVCSCGLVVCGSYVVFPGSN